MGVQVKITDKSEQTLRQWNSQLKKAEERLENSKKSYEIFKDQDSLSWIMEDTAEIERIKEHIRIIESKININP